MKKIFSCLFIMLLLVGIFAGCGKKDQDGTESAVSDTSDTGFSAEDINLLDEYGDCKYTIVRPAESSDIISKSATRIYSSFKKQLNLGLKNVDDSQSGEGQWEILIGETNRPETDKAKELLYDGDGGRRGDYVICSVGQKIIILGATDDATSDGVTYFTLNYMSTEIAGGIKYVYRTEGDFGVITVLGQNIRSYNIIRPHYNSSYLMTVELEALTAYIADATGYHTVVKEDRYEAPSEYEIIVGNAERDGVEKIEDIDKYSIRVDGNKIYLNGGSYHATAMAISEFTKAIKNGNITADVAVSGDYYETVENYDRSKLLNPTWYDEFNGKTIDTSVWTMLDIGQDDSKGANGKKAVRSADPAITYVHDGKFTIAANYDDKYYYGGKILSHNKLYFRYGFIEMSAIVPRGQGFWTTLWLCGEFGEGNWSPEIDVNEGFGSATVVGGNYHCWPTNAGKKAGLKHFCDLGGEYRIPTKPQDDEHLGLNFHTYGFLWSPERICGTVDGNIFTDDNILANKDYEDTFNDDVYLIISLANHFANSPAATDGTTQDEWENTNKFIVENVYIYQYFDGKHTLNGSVVG